LLVYPISNPANPNEAILISPTIKDFIPTASKSRVFFLQMSCKIHSHWKKEKRRKKKPWLEIG
jgi:hypothetical protein